MSASAKLCAAVASAAVLLLAAACITSICDRGEWSPSSSACSAVQSARDALYSLHRPLRTPRVYRNAPLAD
jgi:hypothetical protein